MNSILKSIHSISVTLIGALALGVSAAPSLAAPRPGPATVEATRMAIDTPSGKVGALVELYAEAKLAKINVIRAGQPDRVYIADGRRGTVSVSVGGANVLTVVYPNRNQARATIVAPDVVYSFGELAAEPSRYQEPWATGLREFLSDDMRALRVLRQVLPEVLMIEHAFMLATGDDSIITGGVPAGYALADRAGSQNPPPPREGSWACLINCIAWGHDADICWLGCGFD